MEKQRRVRRRRGVIDMTPTWEEILPTWLMIARDAYLEGKQESIANFEAEMKRMARLADLYNASCKAEKPDGCEQTY